MRTISTLQLDALLQNSTPIESDGFGLKVARLSDGNFLKFYRRKRLLSMYLRPGYIARMLAKGGSPRVTMNYVKAGAKRLRQLVAPAG